MNGKTAALAGTGVVLLGVNVWLGFVLLKPAEEQTIEPTPITSCYSVATEELYAKAKYACPDGRVYTFANEEARDNWSAIATQVGVVELSRGSDWIKVK